MTRWNKGQVFDHVLIIMFENQYRSYVMENRYMRDLAAQGVEMTNYFGCFHPSQTNYIASVAGEVCNVTDDDPPPTLLKQRTIIDLIEESPHDLSWKAYMESYIPDNTPWTPEMAPKDQYPYVIKHDPFSSFENIVRNQARWRRVQNEADFWSDLLNGELPNYAWFTPNMWSDGHYLAGTQKAPEERAPALVDQLSTWLEGFFAKLRFPGPDAHLPPNTLVVVTFDEADFESKYDAGKKYTYDGPNQIYTVLLGDGLTPGQEAGAYNHYSLIRTIEKNFDLADLGKNDRDANWFRFLWRERFAWDAPQSTPLQSVTNLAASSYAGALHVVVEHDDALSMRTLNRDTWTESRPLPFAGSDPLLTVCDDKLLLAAKNSDGTLFWSTYEPATGWSDKQTLHGEPVQATVLTTMGDGQAMLAAADADGAITSWTFSSRAWSHATPTGFTTAGELTLATLGATLLLIFQERGDDQSATGHLLAASYNTGDFNVVTYPEGSKYSGPYDDMVKDAWAKNAYPVAYFGHGPNPTTPGEDEPLLQPYKGAQPLTAATLDGVIHLIHAGVGTDQLLTETYSLSGIMTPKLKISYQAADQTTTSNGYGALAEAGWTPQQPIAGAFARNLSTAATHAGRVYLFHGEGERLLMTLGGYRPKA